MQCNHFSFCFSGNRAEVLLLPSKKMILNKIDKYITINILSL
jgi:hypothetical protein